MNKTVFAIAMLIAAAAQAQSLNDGPAEILLNEFNVRGPGDITILLGVPAVVKSKTAPTYFPECAVGLAGNSGATNALAFSGTKPLHLVGNCTQEDVRQYEQRHADFVRFHLGDRGRH